MQVIPLQAVPAQRVNVQLSNQSCLIVVRQKVDLMFLDLYVNNALVIGGVVCENLNRIVRDDYLGFVGDLLFLDSQPVNNVRSDPFYSGLGTRFSLIYLDVTELPVQGAA